MSQDYNPKIYVMQLRELICTAIFIVLTIILIIVMISMFAPDNEATESSATPETTVSTYIYGYNKVGKSTSTP